MKGVLPAEDENKMELLGRTLCNCKVGLNANSLKRKVVGFFPFPGFRISIWFFVVACLVFLFVYLFFFFSPGAMGFVF